ncbi:glutathione S-transferase family protein [Rickettsiales endosymbiont of Stachyamoeba lipophora]|uniref:glutathione S-transferase family protein n=1 Tax=Rickettsiales endosymbiont of Stachyamoeba lipophora TaxID=2486578 RepID=UPI000F64B0E8|nr:glutathione S-transferase family protein [Rickettsiales endosymbiont of Stachyamoeba lipophora]AZL15694.1 glutathione S-transferase family protein [Rickettsiales endosymbiont of Stachyamoeba lipophora]
MNILYYHPLCAKSRFARVMLGETNIPFHGKIEEFWNLRDNLIKLNPAQELPILVYEQNSIIGILPIIEFLSDLQDKSYFYGASLIEKAETRRLVDWCIGKFYHEVLAHIVSQKLLIFYDNSKYTDSNLLRHAKNNAKFHLKYFNYLIKTRGFLSGDKITVADFGVASLISILDYLNDINWIEYRELKIWYSILKSRPSFKPLLDDVIAGFIPSSQYKELDF